MMDLLDWQNGLGTDESVRAPTETEIEGLRARGNRGDLHLLRLGAGCSPAALEAIHDSRFFGPTLLLGPVGPVIEASTISRCVLANAIVRGSHVTASVLGDGTVVEHHAVLEHAVLMPIKQRTRDGTHALGVQVRDSHVSHSIVLGGTDIGPYCHVRSHSLVGPFAHIGTGSELKAACVLGATARNRIELPHRSYFGNASAKAVCVPEGEFGDETYLASLEEALCALLLGRLRASTVDEDIPGAVQPRERLVLSHGGKERVVEVEGVNLGALTTTSNFDPRNGGTKLPTNIEAGVRFGILAMAQSPVHVAEGVLVASGAKIAGSNVPPASLVLPGGSGGEVLAGYLDKTRGRLGEGSASTVAITMAYLRQLLAFERVAREAGRVARGLDRVAAWRAAAALAGQVGELSTWLRRYLDVVARSLSLLEEDVIAEGDEQRRARIRVRIEEQRGVVEKSPVHAAELDALRESAKDIADKLLAEAPRGRVVREHGELQVREALRHPQRLLRMLAPASDAELAAVKERVESEAATAPPLFGTSGIRGPFAASVSEPPSRAFPRSGDVSPALAYLAGRALGRTLAAELPERTAKIAQDVRHSGDVIVQRLADGLAEEGFETTRLGITTTPNAIAEERGLVLVVTASHNPPADNGVKVFVGGIPLARHLERRVESEIRILEELALLGRQVAARRYPDRNVHELDAAGAADAAAEAGADTALAAEAGTIPRAHSPQEKHAARLREAAASLGISGRIGGHRVALDLAHGAGACEVVGAELVPAPAVALFLEENVIVVGYGTARDGGHINDRLGAAYAYGEGRALVEGGVRDVSLGDGELVAFAVGAHGHGVGKLRDASTGQSYPAGPPASRTVFWPAGVPLPERLESDGYAIAGGHRVYEDIDAAHHDSIRHALEETLAARPHLPALAVDGDADRTLLTDQELARRHTPFLSGDDMLRLFAVHSPGDVRRVVFTVESGIGLEKFFDVRGITYDVVTVGDRAVAECLLGRALLSPGAGWLFGGEPSGHVLFCQVDDHHVFHLTDDPFVVHLHAIAMVRRTGKSLGTLLAELDADAIDPPTARKPDAWARDQRTGSEGISLAEKAALRLWGADHRLSVYAARLVPDYLRRFADTYARVFHGDTSRTASNVSDALGELRVAATDPGPGKLEVPAGEVQIFTNAAEAAVEWLSATLQITAQEYFGPDDIVLRFYTKDAKGSVVKVGELVSRNSGTSPKNAAYHKLWPVHVRTGRTADTDVVAKALHELAKQRADFTDRFVLETLRGRAGDAGLP